MTNAVPGVAVEAGQTLRFRYVNWRGEEAERCVIVQAIWFGSTEWYCQSEWLLRGIDQEKGEQRDFAMSKMWDVRAGDGA